MCNENLPPSEGFKPFTHKIPMPLYQRLENYLRSLTVDPAVVPPMAPVVNRVLDEGLKALGF